MTLQPARAAAQVHQRLVQRCVIDFLLGEVARLTARHDGDMIGGAVFLAVKQATSPLVKPPVEAPARPAPPRAISVRAVAQSLGASYETTRRRVMALEKAGLVRRLGESGVAVTPLALDRPEIRKGARASHEGVLRLYSCLADLGIVFPSPTKPPSLSPDELDMAVAACCGDFVLRVIEIRAVPQSSMLGGLVFAALMSANADPFTYDRELAHLYGRADTPPPDSARRPATITEIAQRIGLPHEVVRRRVLSLISRGYARRVISGYLVNMDVLQSQRMLDSGLLINQRFVQMTQGLLALGVDPNAAVEIKERPLAQTADGRFDGA